MPLKTLHGHDIGVSTGIKRKYTPAGSPPVNTVAPSITGTFIEGNTLTAVNGTWTGTATITYTYEWQRDTVPISGATASTYTLVTADVSHTVRVKVTATNAFGNASANASGSTVTAAPDPTPVSDGAYGDYISALAQNYWNLQETTSAQKYANKIVSGNYLVGLNSPTYGSSSVVPSEASDVSVSFDGSGAADDILVTNSGVSGTIKSVVLDFYPTTVSGVYTLFGRFDRLGNDNDLQILQLNKKILIYHYDGTNATNHVSADVLTVNTNNHLVYTSDTSTSATNVYINGTNILSFTDTITRSQATRRVSVGAGIYASTSFNNLAGKISHVATYDFVISPSDVTLIYDMWLNGPSLWDLQKSYGGVQGYKFNEASGTTANDIVGIGLHPGTYASGVNLNQPSIVNSTTEHSFNNGSNVGNPSVTCASPVPWYTYSTLSISFVFSVLTNPSHIGTIVPIDINGKTPQNTLNFQINEDLSYVSACYFQGQGQNYHADYPSAPGAITVGEKYLVVMNLTGTHYELYINGAQIYSDTFPYSPNSSLPATWHPLAILDAVSGLTSSCDMQNFMLHNRALTTGEITALQTASGI